MKARLQFFNFTATNESTDVLDINIDGAIVDAETQEMYEQWYGDDTSVSYKSLRGQVANSNANTINFYINSGGGMVTDAMAIHDWIVEMRAAGKTVNTIGRGIVCSAATYILMAGNSSMSANSWFMIHNVSGGTWGDVNDIENYAASLRQFNDATRDFYANYTGLSATVISNMMNAETWMTAQQALDKKFIKSIAGSVEFTNSISADNWQFKNMAVLQAYNSSSIKNDTDMVNKIVEGITNALKELGLMKVDGATNVAIQPITNEALTAALTTALAGVSTDIETMVNTAVATAVTAKMEAATTNFTNIGKTVTDGLALLATKAEVTTLTNSLATTNDELKAAKDSFANKNGGEAALDQGKGLKSKNDHPGVSYS